MNKYPLIGGSILTVVLLVFASLSNVVGYQSVKSTPITESPLFNIRTQRATIQRQNVISSQYLGKGKNSDVFVPVRNETIAFLTQEIQRIKAMSEATFSLFVNSVVQQIHQNNKFRNIDDKLLVAGLYQLRQNQPGLKPARGSTPDLTWYATPTACWFPGCFVTMFITFIIVFLVMLSIGFTMLC